MYLVEHSEVYVCACVRMCVIQDEERLASLSLDDLHRVVLGDQEASDYEVQRARQLLDDALQTL